MTRIAIMQPYFIPYAGYFRLFSGSDLMVLYDDVQFPKEGWVHRNRLLNQQHEATWLTLPMKKMSLNTKIADITFSENHDEIWQSRLRRFPLFEETDEPLIEQVRNIQGTPFSFIAGLLRATCNRLSLPFDTVKASSLDIDPALTGQNRVISIVKQLGGTEYINAPGGTSLYDSEAFRQHNIKLHFLREYVGDTGSILQRLAGESVSAVRQEILTNTQVMP